MKIFTTFSYHIEISSIAKKFLKMQYCPFIWNDVISAQYLETFCQHVSPPPNTSKYLNPRTVQLVAMAVIITWTWSKNAHSFKISRIIYNFSVYLTIEELEKLKKKQLQLPFYCPWSSGFIWDPVMAAKSNANQNLCAKQLNLQLLMSCLSCKWTSCLSETKKKGRVSVVMIFFMAVQYEIWAGVMVFRLVLPGEILGKGVGNSPRCQPRQQ